MTTRWRQRFRAPSLTLPRWGLQAPDHLVYGSNVSGSWQVHAWDRSTGTHRKVTEHPTGVLGGVLTPDGERIVWFEDAKGDEIGTWLAQPFEGGDIAALLPELPASWSAGLAFSPGGEVAVGLAARDGFSIRVGALGAPTREVYRHEQSAGVADLSRDGSLLVIEHAEHGDNLHPALRALDAGSGALVADLWDGPGFGLHGGTFSPVEGDQRLVVLHELEGMLRPAIWNPRSGERTNLTVALPGEVSVEDWWPDGSALLLVHSHLGRDELYRLDLGAVGSNGGSARALERLEHPAGSVQGARVRPDGSVWYRWSSGAEPPQIRVVGSDAPVLRPPGEPAPGGVAYQDWNFANEHGDTVYGFLAVPGHREAPHPTVLLIHGGPHACDTDAWSPQVQAWVDHGVMVALVNYRGSTGFGKAWQDALEGNPGKPEVEDVMAGCADLVARGLADYDGMIVAGASWGGYITLMTIGTAPDGWRAALAVVPVADYVSAYADESEGLQAFDRSLFGGSPEELPELYRERSPISWAERVSTPVLLMVGENDTRCPLQQVLNYAERLDELGKPYQLDRFDAGHGALVIDERIRQMEVLLAFARAHVPGVQTPGD